MIFLLALALATQGTTAAEVQVRPNGDRIDVIATAATLQDVLTRLSQQTGMKVVYDGAPPRALVTVSLVQRTPAEAVLSLFEGLGLNYALSSDRTGTRVEMLIISTATGGASPSRPSSAPVTQPTPDPRRGPQRPPPPVEDEREEEQQDENAQKPQPQPSPQGPVTFQGPIPGPGRPGSPFGGGQVGPLTFPTPQQNLPTPPPTPSPTPTPNPT